LSCRLAFAEAPSFAKATEGKSAATAGDGIATSGWPGRVSALIRSFRYAASLVRVPAAPARQGVNSLAGAGLFRRLAAVLRIRP
jgi:hypothetical protein